MEFDPNKVYTVKVSEIYKQDDKPWSKEYSNTTSDNRTFKSYMVRVKFNEFGDESFSGFVNESKKYPGTPAIWEGMEMFVVISAKEVEKDGETKTYYNFKKLSQAKKEAFEKDAEIAALKAKLEANDLPL